MRGWLADRAGAAAAGAAPDAVRRFLLGLPAMPSPRSRSAEDAGLLERLRARLEPEPELSPLELDRARALDRRNDLSSASLLAAGPSMPSMLLSLSEPEEEEGAWCDSSLESSTI